MDTKAAPQLRRKFVGPKGSRCGFTICALSVALSIDPVEGMGSSEELAATPDSSAAGGVYIPADLNDALEELARIMPPRLVREFQTRGLDDITSEHHFGVGRWLRNTWGLWADSRLALYFRGLGICHPDDMSAIILESYWRQLRGKPIGLEKQVSYYQRFWRKQGVDPCRG